MVYSTRASAVIPKLDKIFAVHGIPNVIISDNGPMVLKTVSRVETFENGTNPDTCGRAVTATI